VQVRAHGETVPATAFVTGDVVDLALQTPQRGVAPGQAAVMYDGERVVGSVTIGSTSKAS
jgi:tRNA-specific 2-thiouridylase